MIKPLRVILPQMIGYIKYFENGRKNMLFKIEEESVYLKYTEIWNKIKSVLNVKFHSQPIYDDKYIKTKVKTFNNTINTLFSGDEIPEERIHYVYTSPICIDSVLRTDKKHYPQVYLEQCKYKIKKRELVSFADDEVLILLISFVCLNLLQSVYNDLKNIHNPINYQLSNHYFYSFQQSFRMFLLCCLLAHQKNFCHQLIH